MSVVGIVVVVVVAIFAASILGAWLRGGTSGPQGDSKAVREDVQRMLTTQAQGFAAQMGQLTQLVSQQLSEVRRDLEQGVTSASQITNDAQRDMTEQLRSSTDVLNRLNQHLGEVQQSGRELTQAAQTMLTANPGLTAIYSACGPPALGAIQSIKNAGAKVILVGFDGLPDEVTAVKAGTGSRRGSSVGGPPASALARVITSGSTPSCW